MRKRGKDMTQKPKSADTPVQPTLAELMAGFLARQAEVHAAGLGRVDVVGEVEPYEAVVAPAVEPRLAWEEACEVVRLFRTGEQVRSAQPPAEWPGLVAAHEPVLALAFAAGNYPQLVRSLHALMHAEEWPALREPAGRPLPVPGVAETATAGRKQSFPPALLTLGTLRLAKQFDLAAEFVQHRRDTVPAEWAAAWANEEAALAWHRGRAEEAAAAWQAQPESVPVLFNRGMAALFLGRPADARTWLRQATAQLPDAGAWHHLGRLYLALAEMRG
jgi:hypothetical protein